MAFELRPYQREAVDSGVEFLRRPAAPGKVKHGITVLPTGSGKSLVIAQIVAGLDAPCLVFQPSKEILEQNLSKFVSYGYQPAVYSASMRRKQVGEITLATIGSVVKEPSLFEHVRYVIVDECHLVNPKAGMYQAFFKSLGEIRILGTTATPYRLSTDGYGGAMLKFLTRTVPRVFSELVYYVQIQDLHRDGYLADLKYYPIRGFDRSQLRQNSTGAEFDQRSIQMHFKEIRFENKLIEVVNRLLAANRRGILVFNALVEESLAVVSHIPGASVVTAETKPKERRQIIADFRAGRLKVVCNVGVLGIGFDYPELDTIVLARPTMSLDVYYQQVGRGLRPHPSKESAWIIDMVGMVEQFGKVEDFRIDLEPSKRGEKWAIFSGEKKLTNCYYGDPPDPTRFTRRREY